MADAAMLQGADERFREVSGTTYVMTLLQGMVRRRVLVSVFLPGSDIRYTSTVLSVDPATNSLLMDEVFPLSGHALLQKGRQARLFAHLGGAALEFTASLQAVESENGLFFYRLAIPETVHYLQRRDDHRVKVTVLGIRCELYDHRRKVHSAILYDISSSGLSLQLDNADAFHADDVFRCTLHLPGEEPFQCMIDISSKREQKPGWVLGGRFVDLDKRGEHALQRVVAELERQLMRKRREPPATPEAPHSA